MKFFGKILFILVVIAVVSFPLLAQQTGSISGGAGSRPSATDKPTLIVNSNVRGASVEVVSPYKNGSTFSGTSPFSTQLDKGTYVVTVSAPGFKNEQQTINLSNSTTLNFSLNQEQPAKAGLTISSNVRDAEVIITGQSINGQFIGSAPFTAQLEIGRYNITVSAAGYVTKSQEVNLTSSTNLTFNLDAESYNMTITSNVAEAKVFIKGGDIRGQITGTTDLTTVLPPGTYTIKVNAPHYFAEEKTIQFNGSTTVDFQLRGRTGKLEVIIPNNILDYSKSNPAGRVSIFDNGTEINGTSLELTPGQHTIRITSGGFASQQTINVKAGESYRVELNFGFALIKE